MVFGVSLTRASSPQLCDLYENDCIFDKFDCCISGNSTAFATGTYSNFFKVFTEEPAGEVLLESTRDPLRKRQAARQDRVRW